MTRLRFNSVAARLLAFAVLACGLLPAAWGQEENNAATDEPTYTDRGADRCLKCHDEFSEFPVMEIFDTKHAEMDDPDTPFAKLQCETCHGPGSVHAELGDEDEEKAPQYIRSFRKDSHTPVEEQNQVCESCHQGGHRMSWQGSRHQQEGLACVSCHDIHATHDKVREPETQTDVCYQCHTKQRAQSFQASSHPLRHGQMVCSSCHEPHGSLSRAMLKQTTVNQTCYECHPEKRGPFLWEHAPVTEDCSSCHTPHGSSNQALLEQRPPLLCQQCHSQAGHPSVAYTADDLPGGTASPFLLGRSCMNCHSKVHGSNHPSGIKLQR